MIGMRLAWKKWTDLDKFTVGDIYAIFGKTFALSSAKFAEYVRDYKLSGQSLYEPTGETKESTKPYRMTKKYGVVPAYLVRPGVGIPGSLNYLYGMARGFAVAKSGKQFFYARPRPFIKEAWEEWGGKKQVRSYAEAVKDSVIQKLLSGAPEIETTEVKA
jgi:hypothetical protein